MAPDALQDTAPGERAVRARVVAARERQAVRYAEARIRTNVRHHGPPRPHSLASTVSKETNVTGSLRTLENCPPCGAAPLLECACRHGAQI